MQLWLAWNYCIDQAEVAFLLLVYVFGGRAQSGCELMTPASVS